MQLFQVPCTWFCSDASPHLFECQSVYSHPFPEEQQQGDELLYHSTANSGHLHPLSHAQGCAQFLRSSGYRKNRAVWSPSLELDIQCLLQWSLASTQLHHQLLHLLPGREEIQNQSSQLSSLSRRQPGNCSL